MEMITGNSILDEYFDEHTMSLHLKENTPIIQKKWSPGNRKPIRNTHIMKKNELTTLIDKIYKELTSRNDSFLEIDRKLSKVLQIGPYRIVIVYPPLSDGIEMTVVKPTTKLSIEEYNISGDTIDLLKNKAKGILISWAPGSGKTTFAQALIEIHNKEHKIIKTIESPRDLQLPENIVQYSFTYWTHDEVRDILLLSRPDYTVYDEVRNASDFLLYKDLRLTGIGLVGVIHATKPIDSIQRFLGNIEMGIIPQVIDTVIYIEKGIVQEIYQLNLTVKVPEGMMSDELARPVIVISSVLSKKDEYEIYTFWEQIVVMPIDKEKQSQNGRPSPKTALEEHAKENINIKLQNILPCDFISSLKGTTLNLYIPEGFKGRIIGKGGEVINNLEKQLGIHITVKSFNDLPLADIKTTQKENQKNNNLDIQFPENYQQKKIILLIGDEILKTYTDTNAIASIKIKPTIKIIHKKWFVIVDTDNI